MGISRESVDIEVMDDIDELRRQLQEVCAMLIFIVSKFHGGEINFKISRKITTTFWYEIDPRTGGTRIVTGDIEGEAALTNNISLN